MSGERPTKVTKELLARPVMAESSFLHKLKIGKERFNLLVKESLPFRMRPIIQVSFGVCSEKRKMNRLRAS